MIASEILGNPERTTILEKLELLQIDETGSFDRLTSIATRVLNVPVSLVSIVAVDHQHFLGNTGLAEPYATERQTPLSHSFCKYVVASQTPLVVEDARENPALKDNLAIPNLNVIAYLGIPLITSDNVALGSFCVIDHQPRKWTDNEIEILTDLAASVMTEVELRHELRKRQEAEAQLEATIRDREQMRVARAMVTALSHDLRNPLSSVRLKVDMISKRSKDEKILGWINAIEQKLDHVTQSLNDFTLLWSNEVGANFTRHIIKANHLIESIVGQIMSQQHDENAVEIRYMGLNSPATIKVNQLLMQVALTNIIENAILYSVVDHPTVEIIARRSEALIHFDIIDNGIGIAPEDLMHVFDPLYKADQARTITKSGSGLGLTIAKHIVEDHGGTIQITSKLGHGTTVQISLPIATDLTTV